MARPNRLLLLSLLVAVAGPVAALVDVREFGAVGNGKDDDTAAVQAAIDNVTLAGGGIVWFPSGRYNISQIHAGGACAYTTGPCDWREGGVGDEVILRGEGRSTRLMLRGGGVLPTPACLVAMRAACGAPKAGSDQSLRRGECQSCVNRSPPAMSAAGCAASDLRGYCDHLSWQSFPEHPNSDPHVPLSSANFTVPLNTGIEFQSSHGGIEDMQLVGAGPNEAELTLLHIGPHPLYLYARNKNMPTTMQNYNSFRNLYLHNAKEGIVMDAGPGQACTDKGDSGNWYNTFNTVLMEYVKRGVWLRNPQYCNASGSGVNRCQFYSTRIGQFVNTGIQIDSGGTNTFYGCSFEGINSQAGALPNAKPVAIQIAHSSLNFTGPGGADNNGNDFFGAKFEANEWDLISNNPYTAFFGNGFSDIPKLNRNGVGGNAVPMVYGGASSGGFAGYSGNGDKCCNANPGQGE
jgi:hypothetical protein